MLRCLLVTLYILPHFLFTQNNELNILNSTERADIETLLKKADGFYKTDLDSALIYINKAADKVKIYSEPELAGKVLVHKSKYLLYKKEYGTIISVLEPNIKNARLLSQETLGRTYKDIGHAYKQEWLPDSALVNYIKALKCFERTQNRRDISLTYLALGLVYAKIGNKELSKSFYDKSIKYSDNTELMKVHKDQLIDQPNPISNKSAIEASLDIAKIAEDRNNLRLLAVAYSDIRKEYFLMKDYDKALEYAFKELDIRKQTKFNSTLSNTLFFIGYIYIKQNRFKKAIPILDSSSTDATDSLKLHIYKNLKTAHVNLGNTKKALELMESYDVLKDSIALRNTQASIAEITAQYNDEQQKQQIQMLNFQNEAKAEKISNQRLTLSSTIAGSALLLLLGILLYRNYRSKQELNYSQLNFKLLQTQLNPHFMFNALNEIKLNLGTKKDNETSEHLTAYSKLMRLILEGSDEEFVSLEDDVSLISKFLQLQQMVHDDNFDFKVEIDDALDVHYTKIPPMLTQPFVENAILHGIKNLNNGHIEVNYREDDNRLLIEIKDNGKGITTLNNQSGKHLHQSMGTKIIEQRIKNYKKLYDFNLEVNTISNDSSGTRVSISCPIQPLKR